MQCSLIHADVQIEPAQYGLGQYIPSYDADQYSIGIVETNIQYEYRWRKYSMPSFLWSFLWGAATAVCYYTINHMLITHDESRALHIERLGIQGTAPAKYLPAPEYREFALVQI